MLIIPFFILTQNICYGLYNFVLLDFFKVTIFRYETIFYEIGRINLSLQQGKLI